MLQNGVRIFSWQYKREYRGTDIVQLLKSSDPKDKQKLNKIIVESINEDDWEALRYLLRKGYKIQEINNSGLTFLHWAFYHPGYGILSSGMKFWAPHVTKDVVNIVDSNGLTILHVACYAYQSRSLIEKCLEHNVNVNAIFLSDRDRMERDGFTPLHFAAVNFEGPNWMKLLVDRNAEVNARDARGRTPLHVVCRVFENSDEMKPWGVYAKAAGILLDGNADANARDREGNTPLLSLFPECYDVFTVIEYNVYNLPVDEILLKMKLLLERGADATLSNRQGETVLHLVIKSLESVRRPHRFAESTSKIHDRDHSEMIRQILAARPDFNVSLTNNLGETPLQLAIFYLSADIVKILLDHGADRSEESLDHLMTHFGLDNVPRLEEVANFLGILELFANEDFEIDSERILNILDYLVHDTCNGECGYFETNNMYLRSTNLLDIVNFGSSSHFQIVYERLRTGLPEDFSIYFQTIMYDLVVDNLKTRKFANFYLDPMLPPHFIVNKEFHIPLPQEKLVELESELNRMKSTKMRESVTLYDVMVKHPHYIYQYITDVDLDSVVQDYKLYKDIIRGQLTKSLVRHYVENAAFDYVKELLSPFCPFLCCRMIMDYLANADILNVCRAIIYG